MLKPQQQLIVEFNVKLFVHSLNSMYMFTYKQSEM